MINLLPPQVKESRLYASRNMAMVRASLFLISSVLFLGVMLGYGYYTLHTNANAVTKTAAQKESELGNLDQLQKQAQTLSDTIKTASTLLNRETKFSDLIGKLGALMPEGASLKSLKLTGDTTQPLEVTAKLKSIDQAAVLQKNLLTSDLFSAADIQNVDRKPELDQQGNLVKENPETTILVTFNKTTTESKKSNQVKLPETFKP